MLLDAGDVLNDELAVIAARRVRTGDAPVGVPQSGASNDGTEIKLQKYYSAVAAEESPLSALCLSGGGIRSAAFALGILQGLAKRNILDKFDFLSTVSGGGYAGSFLIAWVQRAGFDEVLAHLRGERLSEMDSPLRHLRRYSNYLNPHTNLFSADRLTNVVLYLRNLLLNWSVILPVIILLVLLVKIVAVLSWAASYSYWHMIAIIAVAFMGVSFVDSVGQRPGPYGETAESGFWEFFRFEILPMLLGAALANAAAIAFLDGGQIRSIVVLYVAFISSITSLLACLIALYFSHFTRVGEPENELSFLDSAEIIGAMVASWTTGAALIGAAIYFASLTPPVPFHSLENKHLFVVLGPPVFIVALFLGEVIYVALTNAFRWGDAEREWLARAAGHHMVTAAVWLILSSLVVVGSAWFFSWTLDSATTSVSQNAAKLASVGSLAGAVTALLGRAKETAATIRKDITTWKDVPRSLVMGIATIVCIFAVVVAVSAIIDESLFSSELRPPWFGDELHPPWFTCALQSVGCSEWLSSIASRFGAESIPSWIVPLAKLVGLGALTFLAGFLTSFFVNINRFSMHGLYRNRLIRTFLGASHSNRNANELTDFDSKDNINLANIWPGANPSPPRKGALPPIHVVNMSLNVVGSSQLAWQERKSISFTATARWIGSGELEWSEADKLACRRPTAPLPDLVGPSMPTGFTGFYRAAEVYGDSLSLGSAMTISGAAVSPNMGYNSSPAYSILMTLFNVRLGAWYGNPGPSGEKVYRHSGPIISAAPLISEALGITTSNRRYVYLSDGGHFENLGIYEMIRRRCRLIVVSDAGEDRKMTFEDLGNAVRRAELDFGAKIRFETFAITGQVSDTTPCFAIGEITYPERPEKKGVLLYLKPCHDDKAPLSVRSYASLNDAFPHEPTTDQFFGETQFEAYRALGEHIVGSIVPSFENTDLTDLINEIKAVTKRRASEAKRSANAAIVVR